MLQKYSKNAPKCFKNASNLWSTLQNLRGFLKKCGSRGRFRKNATSGRRARHDVAQDAVLKDNVGKSLEVFSMVCDVLWCFVAFGV